MLIYELFFTLSHRAVSSPHTFLSLGYRTEEMTPAGGRNDIHLPKEGTKSKFLQLTCKYQALSFSETLNYL